MIQCKGVCSYKYATKRPKTLPYLTLARCKVCDIWISPKDGWEKNKARCPCCHGLLARTPSSNKRKKLYRNLDKVDRPVYSIGEE
tara:strand:- start:3867 stop:4121 length:255 start_codon:yes stop_codon:yes gene_type:complete